MSLCLRCRLYGFAVPNRPCSVMKQINTLLPTPSHSATKKLFVSNHSPTAPVLPMLRNTLTLQALQPAVAEALYKSSVIIVLCQAAASRYYAAKAVSYTAPTAGDIMAHCNPSVPAETTKSHNKSLHCSILALLLQEEHASFAIHTQATCTNRGRHRAQEHNRADTLRCFLNHRCCWRVFLHGCCFLSSGASSAGRVSSSGSSRWWSLVAVAAASQCCKHLAVQLGLLLVRLTQQHPVVGGGGEEGRQHQEGS